MAQHADNDDSGLEDSRWTEFLILLALGILAALTFVGVWTAVEVVLWMTNARG